MATGNNRDVKMTLSVETLGAEDIKKLQGSIESLAKGAGDAAPEFQQLAEQVGRLGQQAEALSGFQALGDEVAQLAQKQDVAATAAAELKTRLDALKTSTQDAASNQRTAAQAYADSQAKLREINGELTILRNTYDANGKRAADYKSEVERLTRAKVEQRGEVERNKKVLDESKASLTEAEAAERKLQASYDKSIKSLAGVNTALEKQQAALAEQRKAVEGVGLSTEDVAASQAKLRDAFETTGSAAQTLAARLQSVADADAFAKQLAEAERLRDAASYVQFWTQALTQAEQAQREVAEAEAFTRQLEEARQLREAASYVKFWEDALTQAEQAQREVAAASAFDKQLEEARQLREAASYVKFWEQALEQADSAQREAAESVKQLNGAFAAINLRNVQEVDAELRQVREAMRLIQTQSGLTGSALATAMSQGAARVAELERELRQLNGTLTLSDKAANLFKNSLGQIAAGNLIADAIGALVEKVKEMGRAFITANIQAETLKRGLTAIYGSSEIAAKQIDFLRGAATRSGIAISGITDSFVKFNAATKSANIPLEVTNGLFESVTRAGATLGLGAERVSLALDALGQIASKGVVSMEELRQQLGDSIPGALSLTAQGLGITDAQLVKLVESGRLASRDFFPAFNKGLQTLRGETESLQSTWERFKNALTITAQNSGAAGLMEVLTGAVRVLTGVVGLAATAFNGLIELFSLFARGAGVLAGAITTLTNPLAALRDLFDQSAERLRVSNESWLVATGVIDSQSSAATRAGTANAELARQVTVAGEQVSVASAAVGIAANEALRYGDAQAASAAASQVLATNTGEVGSQFVQLGVVLGDIVAKQTEEVVMLAKATKGAEEQGQALITLAKLRGDDVAVREAELQATELNLAAAAREAKARQDLAATLAVELAEKVKLAIQQDGNTDRRRKEIEVVEKQLLQAQGEAENSRKVALALQAERTQRELMAETLKDNSGRTKELREAAERLNRELQIARLLYNEGRMSADKLADAQERAAKAAGLYKDALNDQNRAIEMSIKLARAKADLRIAELRGLLEESQAIEKMERLKGNEAAAEREVVRQKQLSLDISRLLSTQKRTEAEDTIRLLEKQRDEIKGVDQLSEEKRKEIDLRILAEKAKLAEAKASAAVVKGLEAERDAIVNRNRAAAAPRPSGSGGGMSGGGGGGGGGGPQITKDSWKEELNQAFGIGPSNKVGTTDTSKNSIQSGPVDASYNFQVQDRLNRGDTFSPDELAALRNGLRVSEQNAALGNAGSVSLEGRRDNDKWVNIFRRAVEQAESNRDSLSNGNRRIGITAPATAAPAASGTRTININLNGRTTQVNVASDADANALESLLAQLESAAGTAGGG